MKSLFLIGSVIFSLIIIVVIIIFVVKGNKNKYQVINDDDDIQIESKVVKNKIKDKNIKNNNGLTYYDQYVMTAKEKVIWSIVGMVVIFFVGMIFYNSIIWSLVLSFIGLIYPKMKTKEIIRKRKKKLLLQFKESLYSLSASLTAGRAVPGAFKDTYDEMKVVFDDGPDNLILQELGIILKRIDRNETIEDALKEFAERSNIEEIETFADVFTACIRTGGNLKKVIMESSKMIGDKISTKQEIETLLSGKEFEAKVLTLIPFGLVFMMKITAPDLLENLYTFFGHIMATIAIIIILISSVWARKIVRIEV